ncbi:heterokaryon incompatibility protein-domain-containing protein [Nemania sp. FL0031]|nr:heterokaryon incompatibility protein-domain-containing protein [Nemania sp. FL0031]
MATYAYKSLDMESSSFRLVRLLKGNDYEIDCELIDATLDNDDLISYEAVSYTWGQDKGVYGSVNIQGRCLKIRFNLWHILHNLRQSNEDRYLWIDAISIDQSNDQERGHQVQRMKDIYSRAERVLICLSLPSTEPISPTSIFMESLLDLQNETRGVYWLPNDRRWQVAWRKVQGMLERRHGGDWESRQRQGLEEILNNPWFRRVWVLQEVGNARRALICIDGDSVSSRIFVVGIQLVGISLNDHTQEVVRLIPGPDHTLSRAYNKDFYYVLVRFSLSEASDERDRIFALQGLCTDENLPKPDYTVPMGIILQRITDYLFGSNSKDLIKQVHHITTIDTYLSVLTGILSNHSLSHVFYKHCDAILLFAHRQGRIEINSRMIWIEFNVEPRGRLMRFFQQHGAEIIIDASFLIPRYRGKEFPIALHWSRTGFIDAYFGEISDIYEDFSDVMKIARSVLELQETKATINVDLAQLRELLLFIPDDSIELAVKMVTGKDHETRLVISCLLQALASSKEQFRRNDAISIFIQERGEQIVELLTAAAKFGVDEVVELLIRRGANVEGQPRCRLTAPGSSIAFGREITISPLSKAGAETRGYEYGPPALVMAIWYRRCAIVTLLLDRGADIEAQGRSDYFPHPTALCAAIISADLQMVQLLLRRNANPNTPSLDMTQQSIAPLELAMARGDVSIITLLQDAGASRQPQYSSFRALIVDLYIEQFISRRRRVR